ncbi:MAG TPA: glycosyltransferase family 4 protein [Leptolyngbyaceae cyanobacterium]
MKISILVSDLSSRGSGRWVGADRPFLINEALCRAGYKTEIVGFGDDSAITQSGSTLTRIVAREPGIRFFGSTKELLEQLQGDIIYACKPKSASFGLALLHRLKSQNPVFLDIDDWELSWHGGDEWKYGFTWRKAARDLLKPKGALRDPDHPLYLKWLESWVKAADVVTIHSTFLKQRFGGIYLPNGKDTDLFNPEKYDPEISRSEYGLSGYRILMFPGAPRPYKGVEDVLEALDLIDEEDLKLVIVGGSPYDDYDDHLLAKWPQRIIQLPKTAYEEMPRLIAAAHIVVVPQKDTPAAAAQFPLKLTDGMSMAKPILATRVGDIPEILQETGCLVEPDSPAQIAQGIRYIFNNYEQAIYLAKQARTRCVTHYSINSMSQVLVNLLEGSRQ